MTHNGAAAGLVPGQPNPGRRTQPGRGFLYARPRPNDRPRLNRLGPIPISRQPDPTDPDPTWGEPDPTPNNLEHPDH